MCVTNWTADRIVALAPDTSSARAGQELAKDRKWVTRGGNGVALWGECQGSGKNPYQVQIDLSEPAFKCSCPSRKFPCKHGLGLFLLFEKSPEIFELAEPPDWVQSWLTSRQAKSEQKAKKAEDTAPDPAAQAKRAAQREAKVAAGLQEFDLWLRDLVRNGLADIASKPYSFWDGPAARLVDAQAKGIARSVRELGSIVSSGHGWQGRMLDCLGRLHLLIQAYNRLDTLPEDMRAEVRTLIGWDQSQENVLAKDGIPDRWMVVGQRITDDDRITTQRTYVIGERTARRALILHFAFGGASIESTFQPGITFEGELAFFDGALPLRSLVKKREHEGSPINTLPADNSIVEATRSYADALARHPWLDRFPLAVNDVTPMQAGGSWIVRDAGGAFLPVSSAYENAWRLLAISGGYPVTMFGEWDGAALLPMGIIAAGRFYGV